MKQNSKTGAENWGNTRKTEDGGNIFVGVNSGSEVLLFDKKIARELKPSPVDVRWLTTCEAAQYLRVSISSIKTMIYRGQVRVHKLGRRNRFLREELERLITLPSTKQGV